MNFKPIKSFLLVTSALVAFNFNANATEPYNPEFLETAKSLEAKYPALFKGFKETDFESIKTILTTKNPESELYIATPPAMFHRLMDRIQRHAGTDPRQLKLLNEMREHTLWGEFNYFYFLDAMFRHAAFLRLEDGKKCEFEEISTELRNNFGERYFRELSTQKPFDNFFKTIRALDEADEEDIDSNSLGTVTAEVRDELVQQKGFKIDGVMFPLYEHHDVGVAYLGYMFLNQAFPIAYPEKFGEGRLHGLTMSQFGELIHDYAHMRGFQDIQGGDTHADKLLNAYQSFLRTETFEAKMAAEKAEREEKENKTKNLEKELETLKAQIEDFRAGKISTFPAVNAATNSTDVAVPSKKKHIKQALPFPNPRDLAPKALELMDTKVQESQKAMNAVYKHATLQLANNTLSLDDYSTLMVGLFNRAHEDYFDGNAVWQARNFADLLDAYFKENTGIMELNSEKKDATTASTSAQNPAEEATQISSTNPFNASYLTGKVEMADADILELVARMPASVFDNAYTSPTSYDLVGGKVTQTNHFMGVELLTQTGEILRAKFEKPNFRWRLNAEHDTYLVNLGSKGIAGASQLVVPDLKRHGDNHEAAQTEATAYFESLRQGMNAIYARSKEIAKQVMPADILVKTDESLRNVSNEIMNLFPEKARAQITESISKKS